MKMALITFFEDKDEMNEAYKALVKNGHDTERGDFEEVEPKELYTPTGAELKSALLELVELNGTDALKDFLKSHGATSPKTLKKSEWAVAYAEVNEIINVDGDLGEDKDEFEMGDEAEDDLFDEADDDMGEAPTAEEVKTAVQKYAQKNSREKATAILKKSGLNTVRGLANATDSALSAIMKAVS